MCVAKHDPDLTCGLVWRQCLWLFPAIDELEVFPVRYVSCLDCFHEVIKRWAIVEFPVSAHMGVVYYFDFFYSSLLGIWFLSYLFILWIIVVPYYAGNSSPLCVMFLGFQSFRKGVVDVRLCPASTKSSGTIT